MVSFFFIVILRILLLISQSPKFRVWCLNTIDDSESCMTHGWLMPNQLPFINNVCISTNNTKLVVHSVCISIEYRQSLYRDSMRSYWLSRGSTWSNEFMHYEWIRSILYIVNHIDKVTIKHSMQRKLLAYISLNGPTITRPNESWSFCMRSISQNLCNRIFIKIV